MARKKSEGFMETIKTVFWAIVIALVVRTFAFEPFNIPSGSMKPTLLVGDYLFVSKYSYGYSRYSLPFGLNLLPDRVWFTEPERGDVIVFKLPTDTSVDYIKRLIGLPGDRIQVKGGLLYINDKPVERKFVEDVSIPNGHGLSQNHRRYEERLPNGVVHSIYEIDDKHPLDNTGIFVVPEGKYFFMGDNRDNSSDSRVLESMGGFEYVPRENLVGRAEMKFFSIDGSFWKFWNWPWSLRFNRFFESIE